MEAHWREPGFTCPNAGTYPWLWLWDSCFHSIIWASLEDHDRAVSELRSLLAYQHANGFVPHVVYYDGFRGHDAFWGASGTSSITQPPIYGHTVAELIRSGIDVPGELIDRATRGLLFLLQQRHRTPGGLVQMVHPWESGCDHSPRWDDLIAPGEEGPIDESVWFRRKGELVAALIRDDGTPVSSTQCTIGSVAFNALISFCAAELVEVTTDDHLGALATELSESLAACWNAESLTWVDEGVTANGSGASRTLEGLLPLLVERRPQVIADAVSELIGVGSFYGPFGLRQVHPSESSYDPDAYWRGPSWPQLNYLIQLGLRRRGFLDASERIWAASARGAIQSEFSEYWSAEDGSGGGARPQSWSGLIMLKHNEMY